MLSLQDSRTRMNKHLSASVKTAGLWTGRCGIEPVLARASFLLFRDMLRLRALERFSGERGDHKRGLSAGKYEMVDWRREGERLRDGDVACLSEERREGSGDEIFDVEGETRDVVWRWSGPCNLAVITIGSNGGRCALVDALEGMAVTREPRCAAAGDVAKDIADDDLRKVSRRNLHNGSQCFIPNSQRLNLMLRILLRLCNEVFDTFSPVKSSPSFTNAYNKSKTYNSSSSLQYQTQ